MIKKLLIPLIFAIPLQTQAFEEYVVSTNGKLTNIKIENDKIINIFPLVTIMNLVKIVTFILPTDDLRT